MDDAAIIRRLSEHEGVAEHPGLASVGAAAFAYAAVLLDDDDNLTRLGNPTGDARAQLRARIEELLSAGGSALDAVSLDIDAPEGATDEDPA